ncbi:hypothetical protein ACQP1K_12370 [Sphaerimonospora sp. CA-214678]
MTSAIAMIRPGRAYGTAMIEVSAADGRGWSPTSPAPGSAARNGRVERR